MPSTQPSPSQPSSQSDLRQVEVYSRQGFGASIRPLAKYALVIVDFVRGFADPAHFGGGNILPAIERTCTALAEARRRNWPIAHSRIVFAADGSDANVFSRKVPTIGALTATNPLSHIVPELEPAPGELVVCKTLPSAFTNTSLQAWLTMRGVRTVGVAGCTTSGCVRATVLDALNGGFVPFVLEDCVGDRAIGPHEANLFDMAQKYAEVRNFSDFLAAIDQAERHNES